MSWIFASCNVHGVRENFKSCVVWWLCCQFGGEAGEQFVVACSSFCSDQSRAQDKLRIHRQTNPKLASFLQVILLILKST